jgi:hypothetical protein
MKFGFVLRPVHRHRTVEIGISPVIHPIIPVELEEAQSADVRTMLDESHCP